MSKRIIACLDVKDGRVVKGVNFIDFKDAGDPIEVSKAYDKAGADELVVLDISATLEDRDTRLDVIKNIAKTISIPLIVGGGMKSLEDIKNVLEAGASKVSINSAAVNNPELIKSASSKYGKDKIIVAIDAKIRKDNSGWNVYTRSGNNDTGIDVISWSKQVEELGAGEILLTSMNCDGTKEGYDIGLTKVVAENVSIPVTASGGAGKLEDFYDVFIKTNAKATLAASLFHFKEIEIPVLKTYLKNKGIDINE
ncbi:MAG TPA: imidazole glycerol phosphate synthase subunit HisF [Acholeplasmataceae bacterium]|nr:imidazole glycerol phosphate synthase subunit HisF [Acholeplasmataceae bacterium]